jgi:succinate dehydrogenase/fumarate reductase flavoprotein subunit
MWKGGSVKMAKVEDLGEVVSADLLIVGGGIGGLVAAIKAKEECPDVDVLIVEKQTVGYAGKAPKTGGFVCFSGPNDDIDKFMEWHVTKVGAYLEDQEMLERYCRESLGCFEKLSEWGVTLAKNAEGKVAIMKSWLAPHNWSMTTISLDMMLPLRAKARKMGVRMLNKIQIVKLLTFDNRVVGAVGFSIVDGKFYIFKAKATLLANGACSYKVKRFWMSAAGEGIAAAYWAGAEMRNAEYGNLYAHIVAKDLDSTIGGMYAAEQVVNALGESLVKKYVPEPGPWGYPVHPTFSLGWEKEVREGRGPIYADLTIPRPEREATRETVVSGRTMLPKSAEFYAKQEEKIKKYWQPTSTTRIELELYYHGEQSCIKVDHNMQTTLPGLFAIGDASYAGSATAGATPAPPGITQGCGLGFAIVSAMWSGPPAARYASEAPEPEVDYEQVKQFKNEIFAPIKRSGGVPVDEIIADIQDVVVPMKINMRRHERGLKEGLFEIERIKRKLPNLWARDLHYLMKCHEAKAMAICAEMMFKAALMRTESRGWHYREDYPERDDKNWLKWIIVKKENETMKLYTEDVPIHKYRYKPQ